MKKVCAKVAPIVSGVDVSHYQPNDILTKKVGINFAFFKATEGTGYVDAGAAFHLANARKLGLRVGAYHFFHPNMDPMAQATHFVDTVQGLGITDQDLPCVMDWETTDGVPELADCIATLTFLAEVERRTGKLPIIYSGPYFMAAFPAASVDALARYPLWVAHYGVTCPLVPPPWDTWTFWQYASSDCDYNYFNGSIEDLSLL